MNPINPTELQAYLSEELPPGRMSEIEQQLREQPELAQQLVEILGRRDAGIHTIGEIWRRHRITCPAREKWGGYLLEILPDEEMEYLKFHLETVGCRVCGANLDDLKQAQEEVQQKTIRRRKYFQSSIGHLRSESE
ncbi:MAG: hypothetical protein WD045_04435 [Pirellulaceae bacterium]